MEDYGQKSKATKGADSAKGENERLRGEIKGCR